MQELEDEYGIDIGEEFGSFARTIVDIKASNYNVLDIIKDYKHIESLREEKEKVQSIIDVNTRLCKVKEKAIVYLFLTYL